MNLSRSQIGLILVALVLIGGGLLYFSQNDSDNEPDTSTASNSGFEDKSEDSPGAEEPTEVSNKPSSEVGETVVIGELETPETFEYPVYTNHFEITENDDNSINITLLAIINRPEQYEEYQAQLKQFKAEALQYLEDNGVETNSLTITYSPEEAADL